MPKVVLFGGGDYAHNEALIEEALQLCKSEIPKITYIPSCSEYGYEDFPHFTKAFQAHSPCTFVYFPIDRYISDRLQNEAFHSDMIFLSGGNTFQFLRDLRKAGLISKFREFSKMGGVLSGLSAGAILLSPSIHAASFPAWDCDDNEIGLKRWDAIGIYKFEYFPHYVSSMRNHKVLKRESKKRNQNLIAVPDEAGIVVSDNALKLIGPCEIFHKGQRLKL